MNSDLKNLLDQYIEAFLSQEEVKRYFILEKLVNEDEEVISLREKLKNAQKKLALSINDNAKHEENKKLYLLAKDNFDNHPYVSNYNVIKEKIYNQLKLLEEKIND